MEEMKLPWDTDRKPDHITDSGIKMWLDRSTTRYALAKGLPKTVQVFFVAEPSGNKTRLIVQDGKPVYEHQNVEAIGVQLDMMKFLEKS